MVSISFKNSVEFFRYEGSFFLHVVVTTNWDMVSVILLQLDTVGLIHIGKNIVWMCMSV